MYFNCNDDEAVRSSENGNVESLLDERGNVLLDVTIAFMASMEVNMF